MNYIRYEETRDLTPDEVDARYRVSAILKITGLFAFVLIWAGMFALRSRMVTPTSPGQAVIQESFGAVNFTTPYKNTLYESFGYVQEPKITLPVKTLSGYEDKTFLLDSGAVVSALPLEAANEIGIDLARSKRVTLQGFSGVPTFAYLSEMTVQIGKRDFGIPAVFTESNKTTYIIGRKGFFDMFTINFDHEKRVIQISAKE